MGMLKTKPFKYGLNTTYWNIDEHELKYTAKTAILVVQGYLERGGEKTEQMTLQLTGDDFIFTKGCDVEKTAYEFLMSSKIEKEKVGDDVVEVEKHYFADATIDEL